MKLVEVIFSLRSGGAEQFVVDIANEFVGNGHQVVLLLIRDIHKSSGYDFLLKTVHPDVKIFSLKSRIVSPLALIRLFFLLKRFSPDIVHLHLNVLPYFFLPAFFMRKIRFFHTIHNVASVTTGYPGQKKVNALFYKHNWITPITISETCRKTYEDTYHLSHPPCICNGRSVPVLTEDFECVQGQIQQLKQHPDDRIFIQVASLVPSKNQLLSIRIFSELQCHGVHAILLLLGKKNEEYFRVLQSKMPKNVFYLGEKKNVGDYMRCADYFMLTSKYEGLPISLLEALSLGCIPICSAVGGIPDVVKDGVTGYLLDDAENVNIWVDRIVSLLNHPKTLNPEFLKLFYQQNYTMHLCAENYMKQFLQSDLKYV